MLKGNGGVVDITRNEHILNKLILSGGSVPSLYHTICRLEEMTSFIDKPYTAGNLKHHDNSLKGPKRVYC